VRALRYCCLSQRQQQRTIVPFDESGPPVRGPELTRLRRTKLIEKLQSAGITFYCLSRELPCEPVLDRFPHVDPQIDCGQVLVCLPVEQGAGLFLRKAACKNISQLPMKTMKQTSISRLNVASVNGSFKVPQ
jgi:hypothetical protein